MSLVNFNIIFDHSDLIYYTGQMVTGNVAFLLKSPKTLKCVKIKIKGKGKVKWSDLITDTDTKGKMQFGRVWRVSDETYFKTVVPLDPQEGEFMLPPGQYLYPFSVMLPSNVPASFVGLHGRVFYYAKATIMFESFADVEKKIFFRVRNILNLNYFPALKTPVKVEKQRKFYHCCCFFAGKVQVTASLPRSGFAKDEAIPLSIYAKNDSFLPIREIIIYLNRKTEWRAGEYRKYTTEKLKAINIRSINANTTRSWIESIPLPLSELPYIENCHIITMKYEIQVKVDTETLNCDLDIFLPISIGDVPITEEVPDLPPSYGEVVGNSGLDRQMSNGGISIIST